LAQGTNWAVAVTQAFFENGLQRFVILHDCGKLFSCWAHNHDTSPAVVAP
jgi:hypothetical protein